MHARRYLRSMGAPTKRARKIRYANEFDLSRLDAVLRQPRDGRHNIFAWTLAEILRARDLQMAGDFFLPARLAESMRTDDALFVAHGNRLAALRRIKIALKPAKGARGASIATEGEALFGKDGVGIHPGAMSDIHGALVDHGIAFGYNVTVPREDGSRIDMEHRSWPIEYVRWDPVVRIFKARVDPSTVPPGDLQPVDVPAGVYGMTGPFEVPIIHGDGRWVIYKKHQDNPFKQGAALLPAALVWARHAYANRDWAKSSKAHGTAKLVGELPAGIPLQKEGRLTDEAEAFIALLQSMMNSDEPIGIRPAGSMTDFVVNNSTAWQIFKELVMNGERAAARIYLGTDGTLGAQGGAPGVDIEQLFGVALNHIEGDIECLERGMLTGVIEPWTAMNFGDSTLAPKREYVLPDVDGGAKLDAMAKRRTAFYLDIANARLAGIAITQDFVDDLACKYCIDTVTLSTIPPGAPPAAAVPAAPAVPVVAPPNGS